jgi:auxin efflux carrier family protein
MGITASAPFNGTDDENLAIAYVSVLILVFLVRFLSPEVRGICGSDDLVKITLFPLGGFLLVVKDFEGPDVESEELRERMRLRRYRLAAIATLSLGRLSRLFRYSDQVSDAEVGKEKDLVSHHEIVERKPSIDRKTVSSMPPSPTIVPDASEGFTPLTSPEILQHDHRNPTNHHLSRQLHFRCRHFLAELLKPCPVAIAFAIVIALVDPLKALFLPPSASFQPRFRPVAPDGQPPLAFVLDTANFIGAAMVPLGLVCLGSALACLRVRSGTEAFPRGAIAALALARMVLTPLIGVGITRWFVRVGFVNRDDKVLQFVCM